MPENDGRWWDTIPKEAVEELHIRQHPYHNPKKPRPECPLCWEAYTTQMNKLMHPQKPTPPPSNGSNTTNDSHDPPMKRILKRMRYWPDEE